MKMLQLLTVGSLWLVSSVTGNAAQGGAVTNTPPLLKVGIVSVDITPDGPVWLAGFAARKSPSTGVFKRLTATCLVFDNSQTRVGLMTLDLCRINTQQLAVVRAAAQKAGIPPPQLIVNCSHTHCGPAISLSNAAYVAQLEAKVSRLPAAAVAGLADTTLDFALGSSLMGVNRRQLDAQGHALGMRPEPRKPIDSDVPVMRVLDPSNQVRAVVFSYACHPTTLEAMCQEIAPDYVGFARDWIAAAYTNATPVFLQGCGGDVKPRFVTPNGKFGYVLLDMKQTVAELGHELGRAVLTAVAVPPQPVLGAPGRPLPLGCVSAKIHLPDKKDPKRTHELEIAAVRIGNLYIVASQCEICVEIGLRIKRELADWSRRTGAYVWTTAYDHSGGGYIPPAAAYPEGGYEVDVSSVGPASEDLLVGKAVELVKSLQR
jgi:hypothetical protein